MLDEQLRGKNKAVILLVEDDPGDQELTRRALQHESVNIDLRITEDGEQAMEYLQRTGDYVDPEDSPTPDLILLDLNMPKKNGREVLRDLREYEELSRIPVVVLTTGLTKTAPSYTMTSVPSVSGSYVTVIQVPAS